MDYSDRSSQYQNEQNKMNEESMEETAGKSSQEISTLPHIEFVELEALKPIIGEAVQFLIWLWAKEF